jgi:hypothetical protein
VNFVVRGITLVRQVFEEAGMYPGGRGCLGMCGWDGRVGRAPVGIGAAHVYGGTIANYDRLSRGPWRYWQKRSSRPTRETSDNPRASGGIGSLRTALRVKVPEIRQRAQAVSTRTRLQAASTVEGYSLTGARGHLSSGFHPEIEVSALDLRLVGRADLLTVTEDQEAARLGCYPNACSDLAEGDTVPV